MEPKTIVAYATPLSVAAGETLRGAVFSVGSISFAGALATDDYDNDIARMAGNVLERFADPVPFEYPASAD